MKMKSIALVGLMSVLSTSAIAASQLTLNLHNNTTSNLQITGINCSDANGTLQKGEPIPAQQTTSGQLTSSPLGQFAACAMTLQKSPSSWTNIKIGLTQGTLATVKPTILCPAEFSCHATKSEGVVGFVIK